MTQPAPGGRPDGRTISVPLWWYPRLRSATGDQRANFEIGRFGIDWPEIDGTSTLPAGSLLLSVEVFDLELRARRKHAARLTP